MIVVDVEQHDVAILAGELAGSGLASLPVGSGDRTLSHVTPSREQITISRFPMAGAAKPSIHALPHACVGFSETIRRPPRKLTLTTGENVPKGTFQAQKHVL